MCPYRASSLFSCCPPPQESELPENYPPQKPLPLVRAELGHHRRPAEHCDGETGSHEQRFRESTRSPNPVIAFVFFSEI